MAQLVEHVIGNDEVISSTLIASSKITPQSRCDFCFASSKAHGGEPKLPAVGFVQLSVIPMK